MIGKSSPSRTQLPNQRSAVVESRAAPKKARGPSSGNLTASGIKSPGLELTQIAPCKLEAKTQRFAAQTDTEPAPVLMDWTFRRLQLVVRQVEGMVLRYLPERLSDDFICGLCGIEKKTLREAFQRVRHASTYNALRTLRVKEVKRRLDADNRLPMEVAMRQCGFGSHLGFAKEFRRLFGTEPKPRRKRALIVQSEATTGSVPPSITWKQRCGSALDGKVAPIGELKWQKNTVISYDVEKTEAPTGVGKESSKHHGMGLDSYRGVSLMRRSLTVG